MIKLYHAISFSALSLLTLTAVSCREMDYGFSSDQIAYRANFEKTFGKVSDIPTWDFSSYNLARMGLAGGPSYAGMTRAPFSNPGYTGKTDATPANESDILASSQTPTGLGSGAMTDGYYNVESGTQSWLDTNLPEGEKDPLNVTKGQPFVLGKPTDNFAIIPIYQGHAGMCWDLHLVDKGTNKDYTIWSKSKGIRYKADFNNGVEIDVRNSDISEYKGDEWNKFEVVKFDNKYFEDYDGTSDIEITIDMPAWRYLKGKFENRYGVDAWTMGYCNDGNPDGYGYEYIEAENNTSYYTFDNHKNDSRKSYTIKLNGEQKKWVREKGIQFVVANNINEWEETNGTKHYDKCSFKYYAEDRVIARVKYNATKWIDLEEELTNEAGHTVKRDAVQAKPIVIDGSKITGDFYLYLKITREDPENGGESGYGKAGSCQRSDEHMMVALPCDKPNNIGSNEYMIIGCEDSNTAMSDWDVNDIVFLCVGQGTLPKIQEVVAAKRYMIEDLGSTFDFDFNDIVVDVTQYRYKNYLGKYLSTDDTYNIEPSNVASAKTITKATLKHLCGTIPFEIKIGNTTLGEGKYDGCNESSGSGGDGCDPTTHGGDKYKAAFECKIDGWDPSTNNITVTTWPTEASGWDDDQKANYLGNYPDVSSTFKFPSKGEFPYIIATDQTVMWTKESVNVPKDWFNTWPDEYYDHTGQTKLSLTR